MVTSSSRPSWVLVKRLYEAALEVGTTDREAFIESAEADSSVRAEVRSLLAHDPDRRGSGRAEFLGAPAALPLDEEPDRTGQRLGPWEIVRAVGSGGMGDVFEARRADGSYQGRAAIKLLKRGMDSAAVLRRFALERQVLARLNHPHIATLLDAGLSTDGLPYVVMEFVEGQPIDVAAQALPLERRVSLFLQLADAVSYAHHHLLVHRDLKPGNVLVTSTGQVKLLDFGIAKALASADPGADSAGDTTLGAPRPFTPLYASPEQVLGEPVTTATDIYSLGVLLYQMLTGVRPTGRLAATAAEAARSVLHEAPLRPSSLGGEVTLDPHWLVTRKRLSGDLDNILLKTLEKPVERRYASVEALSADLRAFLGGFPVSARRTSRFYVTGKFIERHRLSVTLAAVGALGLMVSAAVASYQAHDARIARDSARQRLAEMRAVTRALVFRFGDSVAYLSGGMTIKEDLLTDTLVQLKHLVDSAPDDMESVADLASLHARLAELEGADTSPSTERPRLAAEHADQAIALGARAWNQRKADRPFVNWLARAYSVRAKLERSAGRMEAALDTLAASRPLIEESLALQTRDDERVWLLQNLADALFVESQINDTLNLPSLNRPEQALQRMTEAEQAYRRQLALGDAVLSRLDATGRPEEPKAKASLLHAVASAQEGRALIHLKGDESALALADARAAVQLQAQAVALDPSQVPWRDGVMLKNNTLAIALLRQGLPGPALEAARSAWDQATALARTEGAQSRWANALPSLEQQLGRALAGVGHHAEAVAVYEHSIAAWRQQAASAPNAAAQRRWGWMLTQLSRSQRALGSSARAEASAGESVEHLQIATGLASPMREAWLNLGEALTWQASLQPAKALVLRARAGDAYAQADRLQPLRADYAEALAALRQRAPQ